MEQAVWETLNEDYDLTDDEVISEPEQELEYATSDSVSHASHECQDEESGATSLDDYHCEMDGFDSVDRHISAVVRYIDLPCTYTNSL